MTNPESFNDILNDCPWLENLRSLGVHVTRYRDHGVDAIGFNLPNHKIDFFVNTRSLVFNDKFIFRPFNTLDAITVNTKSSCEDGDISIIHYVNYDDITKFRLSVKNSINIVISVQDGCADYSYSLGYLCDEALTHETPEFKNLKQILFSFVKFVQYMHKHTFEKEIYID